MKALLRYGLAIFVAYFVAWTIAYIIVMYYAVLRLDFSEYFTWLVLAWNFTGFEMVAVTWLLSIAIFIPLVIAAIFLVRRRARREQASQPSANSGLFGR
jgi:membrane protein implicated in regulation of membrane protease activity